MVSTAIKAKCEFCKKAFLAKNLLAHQCLRKARWSNRGDRQSEYAFLCYSTYLKFTYPMQREKSFREFINDQYFESFYDFAGHLLKAEPWDIKAFIRYLVVMKVPVKSWKLARVYEAFLSAQATGETLVQGLDRSIATMQEWASEKGWPWTDYFRRAAPPRIILDFDVGKITPWLLFLAKSGTTALARFSSEQNTILEKMIDWDAEERKLDADSDSEIIRDILSEAGV